MDVLFTACSRLLSGAAYVSGFLMSEKQRKAILTGGGGEGEALCDGRTPIIQAAASYAECIIK
jgi:hypothetical protein